MFDTHCHLNFQAFDGQVEKVVREAQEKNVSHILIPSTDYETSKKAVEVAGNFPQIFAAVGVHPHHVFKFQMEDKSVSLNEEIKKIGELLKDKKVLAVGEVGVDRHYYERTKYDKYQVDEQFISLQLEVFKKQAELALFHKKSLILHNREAKKDFLGVLNKIWDKKLEGRTVFHCCEPDDELLTYAKDHNIFIGVDGDVTYSKEKREFVKKIPADLLVLETDAPFLLPEPYRSYPRDKKPINKPSHLSEIAGFIAKLREVSQEEIAKITHENALRLFDL